MVKQKKLPLKSRFKINDYSITSLRHSDYMKTVLQLFKYVYSSRHVSSRLQQNMEVMERTILHSSS